MVVPSIRVTGANDLAKELGRAGKDLPDLVKQITQKSALMLEAEAKRRAPVRTGRLKNSITTSQAGLTRGELAAGQLAAVYEVGPTVNYGAYVELGTRRMAPEPYLIPAADKIEPIFEQALEKAIDKLNEGLR